MHDAAAFLGRLIGAMLNPVNWVIVGLVFTLMASKPAIARVAVAAAVTVVAAIVLYSFDSYVTGPAKVRGTAFGVLATLVLSAIVLCVTAIFRRRKRAAR